MVRRTRGDLSPIRRTRDAKRDQGRSEGQPLSAIPARAGRRLAAAKKAQAGIVEDTKSFNCGFAWVVVDDRAFALWCRRLSDELDGKIAESKGGGVPGVTEDHRYEWMDRKRLYGEKHWRKGWCFWCPGSAPVQQVEIHEAGAKAFSESLTRALGLRCETGSRLD